MVSRDTSIASFHRILIPFPFLGDVIRDGVVVFLIPDKKKLLNTNLIKSKNLKQFDKKMEHQMTHSQNVTQVSTYLTAGSAFDWMVEFWAKVVISPLFIEGLSIPDPRLTTPCEL